jgi:hypothetical protein
MALELVLNAVFSLIDLLRGSFFIAIIAFIGVFLASFLHDWLSKKYEFSWLKATMLTSYLTIFVLIILLYFSPVISGFGESNQGIVPSSLEMSPAEWVSFIVVMLLRNALVALLFTLFILPLEFFGSMAFDFLKEKYKLNRWINIFIAVFAVSLLVSIICLFLLPWVVPGLVYLSFYWHL